jgi:3-oxo-4,17-pregnadiene-20-carboxyl-CoA hydratase alpha subunit
MSSPPRPVPDPDVSGTPFWEAAARHELVLQTCSSCGTIRHPPRPMCAVCNSMEYTFEQASGRGRIWSWVIAHAPVLPSFAEKVPYNVVVVELDEGVRMVGNLFDVDNDAITEGMPVTVDFEDVEEGVSLPVWRPQ